MTHWMSKVMPYCAFAVLLLLGSGAHSAAQTVQGSAPEARDMVLRGYHDLQGRSAYQPIIQQQGGGSLPTSVITVGPRSIR